jgi:hypothetical protein
MERRRKLSISGRIWGQSGSTMIGSVFLLGPILLGKSKVWLRPPAHALIPVGRQPNPICQLGGGGVGGVVCRL